MRQMRSRCSNAGWRPHCDRRPGAESLLAPQFLAGSPALARAASLISLYLKGHRRAAFDPLMTFDTSGHSESVWDESLEPLGNETFQKEPFASWWGRNRPKLAHLSPIIAEQWIYKHWTRSPYKHLPIERLSWRQEMWETDRILQKVFRRWPSEPLQPEFDYNVFHGKGHEPGLTMDKTGTWNYPVVILETPDGVRTSSRVLPAVRYCLIEGHQRVRYLNALKVRNECAAEHAVFILSQQVMVPTCCS
jgi:hypothetical protein